MNCFNKHVFNLPFVLSKRPCLQRNKKMDTKCMSTNVSIVYSITVLEFSEPCALSAAIYTNNFFFFPPNFAHCVTFSQRLSLMHIKFLTMVCRESSIFTFYFSLSMLEKTSIAFL